MPQEQFCFAVLVHSNDIVEHCRSIMAPSKDRIQYELVDMENGPTVARKYLDRGFDAVLCHGGTGKTIVQALPNSAVLIERTDMDVIKALQQAKRYSKDIILATHDDEFHDIDAIERLLDINVRHVSYDSSASMEKGIRQHFMQGVNVLVGGGLSKRIAEEYGGKGFVIEAARQSIFLAFERARQLAHAQRQERRHHANIMMILEHLQEGVICIDAEGRLVLANEAAHRLLKVKPGADRDAFRPSFGPLGLITAISGNTSDEDRLVDINGETLLATTYSLTVSRDQTWAVSVFRDTPSIQKISNKMSAELCNRGFVARKDIDDIKGGSPVIARLKENLRRYAASDNNIFIQGETGTGKELAAHALHVASKRQGKPFVAVNISALPTQLVESELFGYEDGAFTGARRGGKLGLFQMANHGTLFLDEIGDISAETQLRLLRVMETQEVLKLGGNRIYPIDVRVVSASNKPLLRLIDQGRFRLDLYYRLATFKLGIPPLRDRLEDIPELLRPVLRKYGRTSADLAPDIVRTLGAYPWPGNIRELFAVMENYLLLLDGRDGNVALLREIINGHLRDSVRTGPHEAEDIGAALAMSEGTGRTSTTPQASSLKERLDRCREHILLETIRLCRGDKRAAAGRLGISYSSLCRMANGFGFERQYAPDPLRQSNT